jgi:hypothetical protein
VIALRDDAGLIRYPRWQFDAAGGAPFGVVKIHTHTNYAVLRAE